METTELSVASIGIFFGLVSAKKCHKIIWQELVPDQV